jgi:hypothetical protein
MIDIKNSSTDYLQRSTGTLNNISMIFGMISFYHFEDFPFILFITRILWSDMRQKFKFAFIMKILWVL